MPDETSKEAVAGASVLDEIPGRALTFLRGIANNAVIYGLLAGAGFTSDDYQQGWSLLHTASGYTPKAVAAPEKSPAFLAMQEIDNWDEDGFRRIRAALERLHPEQAAFVFSSDLAASTGPAAVLGTKTLLDRLDALANGKERKATRTEDRAALKTLEARGITAEDLDRLRALVQTAQKLEEPPELPVPSAPGERQQALVNLYAWYKDWTETARSVTKKRAHLITLGLARRKTANRTLAPGKLAKPIQPAEPPVA